MPSGAKKRKAAKRRKQQQQQQLGSALPPGSPTSTTTESSSPPQGNDQREEEDDLTSHDGKGSESGSDVASPTTAHGNRHHLEIGEEEQYSDARKESGPSGSVDMELMDSTVNGGEESGGEYLAPQKMEEIAKVTGEKVAFAAAEVEKDEITPLPLPLPPPSNPVLRTSVEVPISEPEAVSIEHVPSDKDEDVSVTGQVPSPVELNQTEDSDTGDLVEQPVHIVPIPEELVQAADVPADSVGVVDNMAAASSNKNEEKLVPLTDDTTTSKELDPTVESHPGGGRGSHKTTRSSEVARPVHLEHRASWLSCCGLFDVIASASK